MEHQVEEDVEVRHLEGEAHQILEGDQVGEVEVNIEMAGAFLTEGITGQKVAIHTDNRTVFIVQYHLYHVFHFMHKSLS